MPVCNPTPRLGALASSVLTALTHGSAPFITTFLLIRLTAPAAANGMMESTGPSLHGPGLRQCWRRARRALAIGGLCCSSGARTVALSPA
ncbi:hypothetical protein V8E53_004345 [Lactarius tabidus]